jgi:hypothetical protein
MPDQSVTLADVEWQQALVVLCNATGPGINWSMVNPLIMKIGEQLRAQTAPNAGPAFGALTPAAQRPNGPDADPPPYEADQPGLTPSHRRVPRG